MNRKILLVYRCSDLIYFNQCNFFQKVLGSFLILFGIFGSFFHQCLVIFWSTIQYASQAFLPQITICQVIFHAISNKEINKAIAFSFGLFTTQQFHHLQFGKVGDMGTTAHVAIEVANVYYSNWS